MTLISMEDLSAKTAGSMETIGFVLARDLQADGSIMAKAGSQAWGRVDYTAAPGANGLNIDLNRDRLSVGNANVPLRSTQVRDGSPVVAYHRLEKSGKIVIVLYVEQDIPLPPAN